MAFWSGAIDGNTRRAPGRATSTDTKNRYSIHFSHSPKQTHKRIAFDDVDASNRDRHNKPFGGRAVKRICDFELEFRHDVSIKFIDVVWNCIRMVVVYGQQLVVHACYISRKIQTITSQTTILRHRKQTLKTEYTKYIGTIASRLCKTLRTW